MGRKEKAIFGGVAFATLVCVLVVGLYFAFVATLSDRMIESMSIYNIKPVVEESGFVGFNEFAMTCHYKDIRFEIRKFKDSFAINDNYLNRRSCNSLCNDIFIATGVPCIAVVTGDEEFKITGETLKKPDLKDCYVKIYIGTGEDIEYVLYMLEPLLEDLHGEINLIRSYNAEMIVGCHSCSEAAEIASSLDIDKYLFRNGMLVTEARVLTKFVEAA